MLAAAGSLVSIGVLLAAMVRWVDEKTKKPLSRRYAILLVAGGMAMLLTAMALPDELFDRGSSRSQPSPSGDPDSADPNDRYCELAVEFLAHAQQFSGTAWQGKLTKRDFDLIVQTAKEALAVAPQEMRAPMTILASSYETAQRDWSDENMLRNLGLVAGTILSPSARNAAEVVDVFENEHCF